MLPDYNSLYLSILYCVYRICPAEKLSLPYGSVQLVTAFNACHYFDLEEFYKVFEQAAACSGAYLHCFKDDQHQTSTTVSFSRCI